MIFTQAISRHTWVVWCPFAASARQGFESASWSELSYEHCLQRSQMAHLKIMLQADESEEATLSASQSPIDLGQMHKDFVLFCTVADAETLRLVTKQVTILVKAKLPQEAKSMSDGATAYTLAALSLLPAAQEVGPSNVFSSHMFSPLWQCSPAWRCCLTIDTTHLRSASCCILIGRVPVAQPDFPV